MQEVLTVSQLTASLKKHIESKFFYLCVRGEITNFKEQSSGHLYFTLKDEHAQLSAVLFKGNAAGLARKPKDGDQVIARGELSLYIPRGTYQIVIRELAFAGVGELLLKLHQLKTTLHERGWFDRERKKPLPKHPRTIGVVTSATGAVIQDILQVLTRRFRGFHLILNPVRVQGEGAAEEIAQAIEAFNRFSLADVLIVGRGGGSLEDLWAFNEERVASAIYHSRIPIISAVGHETDVSIADHVADLRAPTPSAAAEMVMAETKQHLDFLTHLRKQMLLSLHGQVRHHKQKIERFVKHPLFATKETLLGRFAQKIDEIHAAIDHTMQKSLQEKKLHLLALHKHAKGLNPSMHIPFLKQKLFTWHKTLHATILQKIAHRKEKLSQRIAHLQSINPKNLLTKGYCIPFSEKEDSVILSIQQLQVGKTFRLLLQDGKALVTTKEVYHDKSSDL